MKGDIEEYQVLIKINKEAKDVNVISTGERDAPFWLLFNIVQTIRGCL